MHAREISRRGTRAHLLARPKRAQLERGEQRLHKVARREARAAEVGDEVAVAAGERLEVATRRVALAHQREELRRTK